MGAGPAPAAPATEAAQPAGAVQPSASQPSKAQQQEGSAGQEEVATRPSDAAAVVVLEAGSTFGEKALTKAGLGK